MDKILAFEYIQKRLIEERMKDFLQPISEEDRQQVYKEFNRFKALKLLFFVAGASGKSEGNDNLLDTTFTSFTAYPQGPVDKDVYARMKGEARGEGLPSFIINNETGLKVREGINFDEIGNELGPEEMGILDRAIDKLLGYNREIVSYLSDKLNNISHKWTAWQVSFFLLRRNDNAEYIKMESGIIKSQCNAPMLYVL